ncbi:MAG: glycosyltransferase [Mycobacteriales bacterium]
MTDASLVVLSHLRWDWVWQRPQHIVNRLARYRPVWFVEAPRPSAQCTEPRLVRECAGAVERVWLEVPASAGGETVCDYGDPRSRDLPDMLHDFLAHRIGEHDVWLYTPMAYDVAAALAPRLLIYDVMDDLGSFADAPEGYPLRERRALERADIVFTGGRSLHRAVTARRPKHTYLFPSGVEAAHYGASRALRKPHDVPVAGYVGVLDERLDLELLAKLADDLPDWQIQMAGPVTKIDPDTLPQADNIRYLGMQPYERLPEVMSGFDVALMPFALNAATARISPTKTLEYLAAGLPVVSTRVTDVIADFGDVVHFADTGAEFADACRLVVTHSLDVRDRRVAPIRRRHEWDEIVAAMTSVIDDYARADAEIELPEETA